jgi:hypothetical protein
MRICRRVAVLASLIAVAASAGCTASAAPARIPAEPAVGPIPSVLKSVDLRMPVQAYLPTAAQDDRLGVARVHLIQRCLADFHVAYPVQPVRGSDYGPRSETDRRYGITDAGLARSQGYGLGDRDPARIKKPKQPDLGADGVTALTGSGQSVVRGKAVPPGGCIAKADTELAKAVPAGVDVSKAGQLQRWSFERSRQDSRVVAVFKAWSQCMTTAGFRYADPMTVMGDPAFEADPASAHEIAVALADIRCKEQTNVVGVWFTVESAYQEREIAKDRAGYEAIRSAISARDAFASGLV